MKNPVLIILFACITFLASAQDFITRNGNKLYQGKTGPEMHLRGICFGNWVWADDPLPVTHHNEQDYKRVKEMGMNAVRFYMNYLTFEDDANPYQYKESGWKWIDQNIAWAKKYGVYLILNIHVPQGGFQSQCKGDALWTNPENQKRVTALWKAITARYKNEPQIAGFDLINEPTPSLTVLRWQNLAQKLIDTIRTVDQNHLFIAERAIALGCDYGYDDGKLNFPILKEDNLMYTVHFYEPFTYTHQNLAWAGNGEGGKYPDESIVNAPADSKFAIGQYNNPTLPEGNSDWKYYTGKPFQVKSDTIIAGRPVFYGHRLQSGKAYYDDIVLNEVDANGNIIREISKMNFTEKGNTWFWSENKDGAMELSSNGHNDNFSFANTGTTGYSSIGCAGLTFKADKGKYYAINGWMKGENIPSNAVASITTEFYFSPSNEKVEARNYDFLKKEVLRYSEYPRNNNYPVYFGEFGIARNCYENGRGGENWTRDMMNIFASLNFNFTYHDYHEDSFGLFTGWKTDIDSSTVNAPLKKVFEDFFLLPTGLKADKNLQNTGIIVYPNPSNGSFTILNNTENTLEFQLLDGMGNIILKSEIGINNSARTESNLPSGLYYLMSQLGTKTFYSKVIKQ